MLIVYTIIQNNTTYFKKKDIKKIPYFKGILIKELFHAIVKNYFSEINKYIRKVVN